MCKQQQETRPALLCAVNEGVRMGFTTAERLCVYVSVVCMVCSVYAGEGLWLVCGYACAGSRYVGHICGMCGV